jgi:DNA-binding phage protein
MDAREKDVRIASVKRAAADYALAREGDGKRAAVISTLRGLWEFAAASGAPVEGLSVVNKLISALEELNRGTCPALFELSKESAAEKKASGASADQALAAALVDALNQYEKMPIQEAIDYVAAKRGLTAVNLKNIRQRLRSKTTKDSGQPHYQAALTTIAAQPDPARAIRVQLMK